MLQVRLSELHTKLRAARRKHAEGASDELVDSMLLTGTLEAENMELEKTTLLQEGMLKGKELERYPCRRPRTGG